MRVKKWAIGGVLLLPLWFIADYSLNANISDFLRGLSSFYLLGGGYLLIIAYIYLLVCARCKRLRKIRERKSIAYKKSKGLYMAKSKKREV